MSDVYINGYNTGMAAGRVEGWELAQKEITRLRAEVERRGEMLKRSHGFLIIAKGRLEKLEAKNTLELCTTLMSEIESLDNAPDSSTVNASTNVSRDSGG